MATRQRVKKLACNGVPIDGRDWTEADWQDLHEAMLSAQARIASRHRAQGGTDAERNRNHGERGTDVQSPV